MMEDVRRNRASANLSVKSSALESTYLRNSAGSAYSSCSKIAMLMSSERLDERAIHDLADVQYLR